MAASVTDKFRKASSGTRPIVTNLASQKTNGSATAVLAAATGWNTTTGVDVVIYRTDTSGAIVAGTQTDWIATLSGTTLNDMVLKAGTEPSAGYPAGSQSVVICSPTAAWADSLVDGILVQHKQDGTHKDITADSLSVSSVTWASLIAGWIEAGNTWTYVSATSFKVTGADVTAKFPVGTKIKLTQTTTKYFYVIAASFSTDTTVTITGGTDYSLANAAITNPFFSYAITPQGFPYRFNFTPTWTSNGSAPAIGNGTFVGSFSMTGKDVEVEYRFTAGSTTTFGTGDYKLSLPITANESTAQHNTFGTWGGRDVSLSAAYGGLLEIETNTTAWWGLIHSVAANGALASRIGQITPFTWANTDTYLSRGRYRL